MVVLQRFNILFPRLFDCLMEGLDVLPNLVWPSFENQNPTVCWLLLP